MSIVDIEETVEDLDRVFHHEADFQHELAWHLHQRYSDTRVRLERRVTGADFPGSTEDVYIDIWVEDDEHVVPVELKYKPDVFHGSWNGEQLELRRHSAHDVSRFDFTDDIARIETVVEATGCEYGVVVLLTNDHLYWQPPTRDDVMDYDFRIHDGKTLEGELTWHDDVSAGTVAQKRDRPIELDGTYELDWQDYQYSIPSDPDENTEFRYLLVEVH